MEGLSKYIYLTRIKHQALDYCGLHPVVLPGLGVEIRNDKLKSTWGWFNNSWSNFPDGSRVPGPGECHDASIAGDEAKRMGPGEQP